jgi:hypothetical protein
VASLSKTASCRNSLARAPHWRWLRAVEIDGGGKNTSRKIDGADGFRWIRRALRMKRRYDHFSGDPASFHSLMLRDEDMFWAHAMWADDKSNTRWIVEARVLAGESDEDIAQKVGTTPEIIAAYVNVFFDVREKLENKDYIASTVMGDAVSRGLQERQFDLLWKMLAYRGGTHVLNAVLSRGPETKKPEGADDVGGFFQEFAVNSIKYKAALASLTVPVNTHTQLALIDSYVKYVEIERKSEDSMKAQNSIIDNIGTMLSSMPFEIGTKVGAGDKKMLPFDKSQIELSGDEMMVIAAGGTLSNNEEIQKLEFPGE